MADFTLLNNDILGIVASYTDLNATPYLIELALSPSWINVLKNRNISEDRLAYYRISIGDTTDLNSQRNKLYSYRLIEHASRHGQYNIVMFLFSTPPQLIELAAALNSDTEHDQIHKYIVCEYLTDQCALYSHYTTPAQVCRSKLFSVACINNMHRTCEFIYKQYYCRPSREDLEAAVSSSAIDVLQWIHDKIKSINCNWPDPLQIQYIRLAISYRKAEVLKWMHALVPGEVKDALNTLSMVDGRLNAWTKEIMASFSRKPEDDRASES